jgi:hypothetical protein
VHSYLVHYQEQCLPTRLSQNIVRGSTINRRPNKNLKYGEKLKISLEIPLEFLSGNWQYRVIQVRYLLHFYFVLCYIPSSSSGNERKNLVIPPGKKWEGLIWSVVFIVWYTNLKNRICIPFVGFHGSLFKHSCNLTCVIRSFQLGYHAPNFLQNHHVNAGLLPLNTKHHTHQVPERASVAGALSHTKPASTGNILTRFPATVLRTLLHVKLSKCQPPASK